MFSNPNLLINPDFRINQRGQEVYNGAAYTYTIDRWTVYNSNTTVTKTSNGVTCSPCNSPFSTFGQRIEHLQKGQYTVSFSVSNLTDHIYLSAQTKDKQYLLEIFDTTGVHSATFTIDTDIDNLLVYFYARANDFSLQWAKLELGSIATPFIPPDPATELMKCQRYYETGTGDTWQYSDASSNAGLYVAYCVPKRVNPTITSTIRETLNAINTVGDSLQYDIGNLDATKGALFYGAPVSSGYTYHKFVWTADAEIY